MRIDSEVKLDYNNVLIRPKRSTLTSRKEVRLTRRFTFRNYSPDFPDNSLNTHYEGVPIMAANMDGVGTFDMADKLAEGGLFTCLVKTYTVGELVTYFDSDIPERTEHVAMSIGITQADEDKFRMVYEQVGSLLKYVCIDVANGYTERFVEFVKSFRQNYPNIVIIAGNVVTADQTQELLLNGADIIKVGIGPGSVCTTRIKTGVGYPQLSAVIECADAAHGLGGHIIADGGCATAGDVVKAFAAGADFVMLGGMLAGHVEGGGEVINKYYETDEVLMTPTPSDFHSRNDTPLYKRVVETKKFVQFYGMSSAAANDKHFGGLKEYRSSEGREVLVPYRGTVATTVQDILGGLRSACTYVGADKLKRLSKCTTFILCNDTHNRVYEAKNV
jgi:GMP reductase